MKIAAILTVCLLLFGCGADGAPSAPAKPPAQKTGITISGEAAIGVARRGAS